MKYKTLISTFLINSLVAVKWNKNILEVIITLLRAKEIFSGVANRHTLLAFPPEVLFLARIKHQTPTYTVRLGSHVSCSLKPTSISAPHGQIMSIWNPNLEQKLLT